MVFTSTRGGGPQIYVMNADGSNQHNITQNASANYWADWSPIRGCGGIPGVSQPASSTCPSPPICPIQVVAAYPGRTSEADTMLAVSSTGAVPGLTTYSGPTLNSKVNGSVYWGASLDVKERLEFPHFANNQPAGSDVWYHVTYLNNKLGTYLGWIPARLIEIYNQAGQFNH